MITRKYASLVALYVLTGWGMAGDYKTTVYPVVFGDPKALLVVAEQIVGDEGHVVLDQRGGRLIVLTVPEKHAVLNDVFGKADAHVGNVRIEVRFRDRTDARERGAALRTEGDVVIRPGGIDGAVAWRPELRYQTTEARQDTTQFLLSASGREAVLRVGESVPYIDWIMEYGWHGGYVRAGLQWQEVGAFLVVTPTILADGQTVHVKVTPELRGLVDGQPRQTQFTGLATEVVVRNGTTLSIAGLAQEQDFYSRFLIGVDSRGVRRTLDIELTPYILTP